ncbi:MAG TPA: aromatic amino acid lyase, partial [Firmicutes bacterium]|nr:aromatic amino acid lyase [Bacillota bacterium]
MTITISGQDLRLRDVVAVARKGAKVELSEQAKERIAAARQVVETMVEEEKIVYGITTGFGMFSDTFIDKDASALLQKNLIFSHACGVGDYLPVEVVRAAMLLRVNSLAKGYSGARLETVQLMLDMLNAGVTPLVPSQGSLGASGDLAPLSHIILVLLGEGEALYQGKEYTGAQALQLAGLNPIQLSAKEGLALINGTQIM